MSSDSTMSDSNIDKKMVYLAYRDVFKGSLAKLRKRKRVRVVVERHKDHLHRKQLADTMNLEKTCRILGDLLVAGLFESESTAKATFPALFYPRELENDTDLIMKINGRNPKVPTFLDIRDSPNFRMPNGTFPKSASTYQQSRTHRKSRRIRKPTRSKTGTTESMHQVGGGKDAVPKQGDIILTNPTYLPSRLQHLILAQTQRLLEECCYVFAEKWFPTMLEVNGWDAPEAVELTMWRTTLSKCDIPATAITLRHGESLALLFKRAIPIRHCAVHRRPRIPVKNLGEMVRDAWLLSQALQDDLRAAQFQHWHTELELAHGVGKARRTPAFKNRGGRN
ncbi:hypothetical protein VE03_10700 [Pseudogymnoascus sp. 23342-1-I1]|nr:hypothetical protein VE03_10700 [Pseudogymnoascus sp. 23342-1-I1]